MSKDTQKFHNIFSKFIETSPKNNSNYALNALAMNKGKPEKSP